jgi:hypothetical protein
MDCFDRPNCRIGLRAPTLTTRLRRAARESADFSSKAGEVVCVQTVNGNVADAGLSPQAEGPRLFGDVAEAFRGASQIIDADAPERM